MAKQKMMESFPLFFLATLQRNTMVVRHEELEVAIPEEVGKARAGVSIIYLDQQVSQPENGAKKNADALCVFRPISNPPPSC